MRLAVTSVGMVTPIGHGVVQASASLRAGVVRTVELPVTIVAEEEFEEVAVAGCTLRGVTDGFQGLARYRRIGERTLRDLAAHAAGNGGRGKALGGMAFYVCVSRIRYDRSGILDELLSEELAEQLCAAAGLPIPAGRRYVVPEGHASVLHALAHAASEIEQGRAAGAIILGIDSLVTEDALTYFAEGGRLKTANAPTGFVPGEAGAAIVVEDESAALQRGATPLAFVGAIRSAKEPRHFLSEEPQYGVVLASLLSSAIREAGAVHAAYADLDGEIGRAMDWGHATARVQGECGTVPEPLVLPALSLGNTGAASGGISICAAVRSYARGYAPGPNILISSSSDDGSMAVCMLTRASRGS